MMLVRDFKGQLPVRDPRLLPAGYAKKAVNCNLDAGTIRPVHAMASLAPSTWAFADEPGVDFVAANVSGVNRLLVSGLANYPEAREGGTTRRWGVVEPDTIPTVAIGGTAEEGADVVDTVSYCYTLVTDWGEESAISGASMPVDVKAGEHVELSNFDVPSYAASGNEITHIRVYRTATGDMGVAEFQQVMIRPSSPTGAAVWDVPASDVSSTGSQIYDSSDGGDGLNHDLGAVEATEGWTPPPDGVHSGVEFANGVYALLKEKRVFLSVPGYYYAFPSGALKDYTFELEFAGVGLGVYNQQLIVCTDAYPEIITGVDPQSATKYQFPYQQPCLSKKSIVSTPHGVCYVSPDGLFMVTDAGGQVVTKSLFSRAVWNEYDLADTICAWHAGKIFVFFAGKDSGFAVDFARDDVIFYEDIGADVLGVFVDPEADVLHINTSGGWYAWDSAAGYLTAEYETAILETHPTSFACARVAASGMGEQDPVAVKIYGDDDVRHTQTVSNGAPFRLPAGSRYREWRINVSFTGDIEVHVLAMAHSMGELRANV